MKLCNRILSVLLAITLCAGLLPAEVFAYAQPDPAEKPAEITTAEGETVEVDDEWEETYPYGVFLFADSQANLTEGGEGPGPGP